MRSLQKTFVKAHKASVEWKAKGSEKEEARWKKKATVAIQAVHHLHKQLEARRKALSQEAEMAKHG